MLRAIDGSYLSISGEVISDRINLIYSDLPIALSTDFAIVARYAGQLKEAATNALNEDAILIAVEQIYHCV